MFETLSVCDGRDLQRPPMIPAVDRQVRAGMRPTPLSFPPLENAEGDPAAAFKGRLRRVRIGEPVPRHRHCAEGQLPSAVYYAHEAATGLYAHYYGISNPGCVHRQAKIENDTLTIAMDRVIVKYRFSDADTLQGTYEFRASSSSTPGTFKRHD